MNRFNEGKIYKLVNNVDQEIYIGSTCRSLAQRLSGHKSKAKAVGGRRVYKHLGDIGWEHVKIVLIKSYPCADKMQLEKKERYYIEKLKPSLNHFMPTRTVKEYDQTPERKAKHRAYAQTEAAKERQRARAQTEAFKQMKKISARKYNQTPAAREKKRESYLRRKAAKQTQDD